MVSAEHLPVSERKRSVAESGTSKQEELGQFSCLSVALFLPSPAQARAGEGNRAVLVNMCGPMCVACGVLARSICNR